MLLYNIQLTKSRYSAKTVREIANAACDWGYAKGVDDSKAAAKQQVDESAAKLEKYERSLRTQRLQCVHELATAINGLL